MQDTVPGLTILEPGVSCTVVAAAASKLPPAVDKVWALPCPGAAHLFGGKCGGSGGEAGKNENAARAYKSQMVVGDSSSDLSEYSPKTM